MLLNALVQLGLSQKEAAAYMMLLRVGTSPVSSLAKRLDMKRVTAYSVLDSLNKRGYVTFQKKGNCRRYIPLDPECILEDFKRKNEQLRLQLNLAKECVEKLQAFPRMIIKRDKSAELFFGKEAEQKLISDVNKERAIFIISLNKSMNPILKDLLKLLRTWQTEVHMCVGAGNQEKVKMNFNNVCVNSLNVEAPLSGDLIVQDDKVFFLSFDEEAQLSIQTDHAYATLLQHLFVSSYHPGHSILPITN